MGLKALGIPRAMYTVLFAVGRTIGWISHWKEMIEDPKQRIGRPRQLYLGHAHRKYVDVEHREDQHAILRARGSQGKSLNDAEIKKRASVSLIDKNNIAFDTK